MRYEILYYCPINGKCLFQTNDRKELKTKLSQLRKVEDIDIVYYID